MMQPNPMANSFHTFHFLCPSQNSVTTTPAYTPGSDHRHRPVLVCSSNPRTSLQ